MSLVTLTAVVFGPVSPAGALSKKAAVAQAKKALLIRSDFPKGWTTSSNGDSNTNPYAAQLASCLGVPEQEINYNPPQANSPEFDENSTGLSVTDDVEIFPTTKVAAQQFGLFGSSQTPGCIAQVFNSPSMKAMFEKQIGASAIVGTVIASTLPRPSVSDKATALAIQVPVTYEGTTLTVSLVIVTILSKLAGSQLVFTSALGLSFPSSLEAHLVAVAAHRLG